MPVMIEQVEAEVVEPRAAAAPAAQAKAEAPPAHEIIRAVAREHERAARLAAE